MCGISGYSAQKCLQASLSKSLDSIQHRGPDDSGMVYFAPQRSFVGLGHVRLSVLELSKLGSQPMMSADGQVVMVFNGEIYNYLELKGRLNDHTFTSQSDSEVLIEYFRRFGVEGFSDLRGMFAVAFYEVNKNKLTLLRDQIGVKPLYYKKTPEAIFFSSEIRGLRPFIEGDLTLDSDDLYAFLSCGFVYEPNTGLKDVYKVPAGHYIVVESGNMTINRYFSLEEATRNVTFSAEQIQTAIETQLISHVDLGVFFSGGLDSSVIASVARKPCLFAQYSVASSGLPLQRSDNFYVKRVAKELGVDLHILDFPQHESDIDYIINSIRSVARGTEELISDYTYFASAELSRAARARGFKVMLSGLGGDEVFIGYPRYQMLIKDSAFRALYFLISFSSITYILRKVPLFSKKINRFFGYFRESSFPIRYARLLGYFSTQELIKLLGHKRYRKSSLIFVERINSFLKGFEQSTKLVQAMVLDFYGFLSHNLTVADKSSMSVGLELRVPLLSQELYCGYLSGLRSGEISPAYGKIPLREFLSEKLSGGLLNRPKTGFNPPLDKMIASLGKVNVLNILESGRLSTVLDIKAVQEIVEIHFSRRENNTYKIWQLIYLHYWIEENLNN